MLKRVDFEDWQAIITLIAFIVFFLAFIFVSWRAIRMSKKQRQHMSNLPLESEDSEKSSNEQSRK